MDGSRTIGTMYKSGFSLFSAPSFHLVALKNIQEKANHTPVNLDDRVPDLVSHLSRAPTEAIPHNITFSLKPAGHRNKDTETEQSCNAVPQCCDRPQMVRLRF